MAKTTSPGRRVAIGPALRFFAGKLTSYLPVHTHTTTVGTGGPVDASAITYTPADVTDWNGSTDPGNTNQALDQLADRVTAGGVSFGSPTGAIDIGDSQTDGSASTVPHSDHQHAFPAPSAGYPQDVAGSEADGSATTPARSDHIHKGVTSVNGLFGAVTIGPGGPSGGTPNYRTSFFTKDDFFGFSNANTAVGEHGWSISGGTVAGIPSEANHPGIVRRSVNGIQGYLILEADPGQGLLLPSESFDCYLVARVNQNTSNENFRFGFFNQSANPPAEGIYIEKLTSDTDWFGVTRTGGSENRTSSLGAVNTNFTTFRIRRTNGTTIGFTVDGGTELTLSSTVPTTDLGPTLQTGSAASTKTTDFDYWELSIVVTRT